MFKPLIRLTLIHLIWRQYRSLIIASLIALVAVLMISLLHTDYVAYAKETRSNQYLGWSFVIKWIFYVLVVVCWLWFGFKSEPTKTVPTHSSSDVRSESTPNTTKDDPFQNIRHKPKLTSRADAILNKSDK